MSRPGPFGDIDDLTPDCYDDVRALVETVPYERNRLETIERLGVGTHSELYKVRDKGTGALFCCKRRYIRGDRAAQGAALVGLRVHARARCPYILPLVGAYFDRHDERLCTLTELMGGSVSNIIRRSGAIPEPYFGRIVVAVVKGLVYLQKSMNMFHRDVKPSNMLVNIDGDVKICGFGNAEELSPASHVLLGTCCYLAPERVLHTGGNDSRGDVWSLGVSMLEMATGVSPMYNKTTMLELMETIISSPAPRLDPRRFSPEACDFAARCLEKDFTKRAHIADLMDHPFFRMHDGEWSPETHSGWVAEARARIVVALASSLRSQCPLSRLPLELLFEVFGKIGEHQADMRQWIHGVLGRS